MSAHAALTYALMLGIAGCIPAPKPTAPLPAPRDVQMPPPAPVPLADDWRDWPLASGTWSYARDVRGTRALYGMAGRDAALSLRCDASERRMFVSLPGVSTDPVTVRTTSTTRVLTVQATGGTPAYVAAVLAPGDTLLDAVAFSRGRFVVTQPGRPPLVVPAWAEIGRVVEDCRG